MRDIVSSTALKPRKIRVVFYVALPAGGIGKYTDQLLQRLVLYPDLDVQVICLPEFHWRNNTSYQTRPILASISHRIPLVRRFRFLCGQILNPRRLSSILRRERPDVVHICNVHHLTYPLWAAELKGSGVVCVYTVHDVKRARAIVNHNWESRQLKRFYQDCDALFVHGVAQGLELEQYAGVSAKRIHQVPHGPTYYGRSRGITERLNCRQRLGVSSDVSLVLFFGFMRPEKNLCGFLKAFSISRSKSVLLVAGQGDFQTARDLANDLGLGDRVRWEQRHIDDTEIPDLLAAADWIALPYLPQFTSHSGVFNLAAAYHRPVLATPTVSFKEVLAHYDLGVLCDGFTPQHIAAGIARLEQRLEARASFDFGSYTDYYSWERNAEITAAVYHKLVKTQ